MSAVTHFRLRIALILFRENGRRRRRFSKRIDCVELAALRANELSVKNRFSIFGILLEGVRRRLYKEREVERERLEVRPLRINFNRFKPSSTHVRFQTHESHLRIITTLERFEIIIGFVSNRATS